MTDWAASSFLILSLCPALRTWAAMSSALMVGLPLMTAMRYRDSAGDRPMDWPKFMATMTLAALLRYASGMMLDCAMACA